MGDTVAKHNGLRAVNFEECGILGAGKPSRRRWSFQAMGDQYASEIRCIGSKSMRLSQEE